MDILILVIKSVGKENCVHYYMKNSKELDCYLDQFAYLLFVNDVFLVRMYLTVNSAHEIIL